MIEVVMDGIVYKYKWRFFPLVWLMIVATLVIFLDVTAVARRQWVAVLLLSAILIFFVVIDWIIIIARSDICIDDVGVTRKSYGVIWQKIKWTDMRGLSISFKRMPGDSRLVRSFAFRSKEGAGNFFSRLVIFHEDEKGMGEFLEKMDVCVSKHRIPVVDMTVAASSIKGDGGN